MRRLISTLILSCALIAPSQAQFWKKDKKDKDDKKKEKSEKPKEVNNGFFTVLYDNELSADFGANHLLADHQLLSRVQNKFIPATLFKKKDSKFMKVFNSVYRMSKIFVVDYPLTWVTGMTQSEQFGHNYRAQQLGADYTAVDINLPPVFASEFSGTNWNFTDSISPYENALVLLGGTEANNLMSDFSRKNLFLNNRVLYEEALMYLFSGNFLSGSTIFPSDFATTDLGVYVDQINTLYGGTELTQDKLKIYSFLGMGLDPMNWAGLIGLGKYIAKGEEISELFWIKVGDKAQYLPNFRFSLAPFGPELFYQNYVKIKEMLYELDVRHADGSYASSLGIDLKAFNLAFGKKKKKKLFMDAALSFWNQPEITFRKDQLFEQFAGAGGGGTVTFNYKILGNAYLHGTLGYKSKGFMEGQSLDNDLIFRFGVSYR